MTRRWDIDFFRGIAIILMIVFHIGFDLDYFKIYIFNPNSLFRNSYQIIGASIFLLLVGVSLNLKKSNTFKSHLKSGSKIFGMGLLLTLATYFLFPDNFIFFGILHLIGLSVILGYFFTKLKYRNLIIGIILILIGLYIQTIHGTNIFTAILGFNYPINSLDFFPILQRFGLVLIGNFLGKTILKKELPKIKNTEFISTLGRNSLRIYLFHQPILFGIFYLIIFIIK